ncbi:FMN-binding protein [Carboxylicivirga sp. RSCT41]|uniref:FMN-binding protein n=1 Tax=Carboxylicivirga agarovorans TaxID=3417570 RepID=UPI003D33E9B8
MKRLRNLLAVISFTLLLVALNSCCQSKDSLDDIKDYKQGDKYFKASMVGLHFMIEALPASESDSIMRQMITNYQLPVMAKNAADGTYTGESPYDAFDYKHIVKLTIKDGKITAIDYNEVHKNGIGKEENEQYNIEMSASGAMPSDAYPKMEKQLLAVQNMLQVDAVSGATYSLNRFRYAMLVALMKANMKAKT